MNKITHEDGRVCRQHANGEWYYRVGSVALESVGVASKPYVQKCDREHLTDWIGR